jgi:O-antigen/teichoic acid export membrane protein
LRLPLLERLDGHTQEVVRGAGVAFILRVTGAGFGFLFNVLLARLLGAEGAGIYYLAFTVTSMATVAGRAGLDNALLRFTAAHSALGEWAAVKGVYRKGIALALLASSLSTMAVVIFAPEIAGVIFSEPALATPLRFMALSIVPMSLIMLHGELLKGLKRVRDAALLQGTAMSVLSCLLLLVVGRSWEVFGAVFAYTLASVVVLIAGILLWRGATLHVRDIRGQFSVRLLASTSFPLLLVASMDLVMNFTDTIMLGILGRASDVGVYGVALRTAMLTSFVLIAVNSVAAPKFAAFFRQGDMRALETVARNSTRVMLVVAAPALLLLVLAPGLVLRIFGEGFGTGTAALSILAVGQLVNVATGPVGYLLMMSGHERMLRDINIGGAIMNVSLNVLLIPEYGMNGAAVATSASWIAINITALLLVNRKLNVSIWGVRR